MPATTTEEAERLARKALAAHVHRNAEYLTAEQKGEMGCACTSEIGDSPCDAHPSCAECGTLNQDATEHAAKLARAVLALADEIKQLPPTAAEIDGLSLVLTHVRAIQFSAHVEGRATTGIAALARLVASPTHWQGELSLADGHALPSQPNTKGNGDEVY